MPKAPDITGTDAVEAVFREAARALHPVDGPLNSALSRIATLERQVAVLDARLVAVMRLVDLLAERDA